MTTKKTSAPSLDGDGLIKPRDVACLLAVHRATIWRWVAAGRFPQPLRLSSQAVGYRKSDIRAWLAEQAANRPAPAAAWPR